MLSAKVVCNIRSLNSISSVCLLQSVTAVGLSAFFLVTESLCFHQCGIDIFLNTPVHNDYRSWMLAYCLSVLGFVICSSLLFWLEVRAAESVLRLRLWSGRSRNRRSILAWDKHVFSSRTSGLSLGLTHFHILCALGPVYTKLKKPFCEFDHLSPNSEFWLWEWVEV